MGQSVSLVVFYVNVFQGSVPADERNPQPVYAYVCAVRIINLLSSHFCQTGLYPGQGKDNGPQHANYQQDEQEANKYFADFSDGA